METNPTHYGLSPKVQLKELGNNRIAICKVIKSRIIRKDAEKIVAMANQIKSLTPELEVTLICTRNICSKSVKLLAEARISIEFIE